MSWASIWGAAQPRGTQRCHAFVCRALRWDKRGSAGAACLRCIPGIPSLLPASIGRGWGAIETGEGRWGWCQSCPTFQSCVRRDACVWEHRGGALAAPQVLPVSLALPGRVWLRCRRDAALSRGQGVAVPSRDFEAAGILVQSSTAGIAPQGASGRVLPPLRLPEITVPVTVPAIHTAGVPTTSDACLSSCGHAARLTQPGTTRDEGIALPAINISVQCGTGLAAVPEPKDSEIQPTMITSRNEKLERS